MIRISIPWMVEVFQSLDQLDSLQAHQNVGQAFGSLYTAKTKIEDAFTKSIYQPFLKMSSEHADKLVSAINEFMEPFDPEKVIDDFGVWRIKHERDQFRIVFRADISQLPAYLVSKKENYDIDSLIDNGVGLFPSSLLQKSPEAMSDAMEAGKCLAFERYTACGFHTFRVVESVVRRYWDHVSGGKERPVPETLGNIAGQMEINNCGDKKVYESLKQLSRLHRNPLAHPDVILGKDEAIGTMGMAWSVVAHMTTVLPEVPTTTANALVPQA
ncbi:hypothetical protein ABUK73_04585 [Agrobacterium sp. BA1120]|uniref:hypothetical protein n=1 Tax=Agrobacterium sp. BA1120 TaxID=3228927 RepID=UPI00336AB446